MIPATNAPTSPAFPAGAPPSSRDAWDRPLLWMILVAAAFGLRLLYVLRGHPAFGADEVTILDHVHAWCLGRTSDEVLTMHKAMDLRLWVPALFFRFLGSAGDPLAAIFLNLLGHVLWVFLAYRLGGSRFALGTALFLAVPPPCIAYYGTLLSEFRTSFWVGALLALGAGNWGRSRGAACVLGFLTAYGLFSDLFTAFFLPALLWIEWKKGREAWTRGGRWRGAAVLLGLAAGTFLGLYYLQSLPLQHPGHLKVALADFHSIRKNFSLLVEVFPVFWWGGFPYGYLQNTAWGQTFFPPDGLRAQWMARAVTAAGWILAFAGMRAGWKKIFSDRGSWILFAAPGALFAAFFVFSAQTWDALSCRYLYFLLVPWAVGCGCAALPGSPRTLRMAAAFMLLLSLGSNVFRLGALDGRHPGWAMARTLEQRGASLGYANHWVAALVDYTSAGRLGFVPYDSPAVSRETQRRVQGAERICLVWVEGLEKPDLLQRAKQGLEQGGYRSVAAWNDPGGWGTLEYVKSPARKVDRRGPSR